MNRDAVVVDTLHELQAREERQQVAVLGLGAALLQQQMVILALLARADEQAQSIVVRRR
jgi:hypothetical protein